MQPGDQGAERSAPFFVLARQHPIAMPRGSEPELPPFPESNTFNVLCGHALVGGPHRLACKGVGLQ